MKIAYVEKFKFMFDYMDHEYYDLFDILIVNQHESRT